MNEPRLKTSLCSSDEAQINFFLARRREAEAGKEHTVTMMVMRRRFSLLLLFVMIVHLAAEARGDVVDYSKHDFPPGFVFGAGTSAYQVEGAADKDGRTPSILDTFAKSGMTGGDTGDIACDQYHKYKEDVQFMVNTGLDAYRFSISWSRLIPGGRGPVNPKGLQYYNNLIDELTAKGIQPHVTLHHFDLPQLLEDEYGGWLSRKVVTDFVAYADVCFRMFGNRVKHWTTFNEANIFAIAAYDIGILPPQHCSLHLIFNCSKGNSSTEPYTATHIMLLAHAEAARLYKMKYQKTQKGLIGINLFGYSFTPFTSSREDMVATQRANDFYLGWYLSPLTFGDYPAVMKKNAGSRIPLFSAKESKLVKGSADFIGLNFYAVSYIKDSPESLEMELRDFMMDSAVEMKLLPGNTSASIDWSRGVKGAFSSENEFPLNPWALQLLLEYVKQNYGNPPIYIHENGMSLPRNSSLEDWQRVRLLEGYIGSLLDSIRNGSDTRGYFVWSFLDLFELFGGFEMGFGLYYVDLDDPALTRYPKLSAHWYSQFLKGGSNRWESFLRLMKNPSSSSSAVYKQ